MNSEYVQFLVWSIPKNNDKIAIAEIQVYDHEDNLIPIFLREDLSLWYVGISGYEFSKIYDGAWTDDDGYGYWNDNYNVVQKTNDKKLVFMFNVPNPQRVSKIRLYPKIKGSQVRSDSWAFKLALDEQDVINENYVWTYYTGFENHDGQTTLLSTMMDISVSVPARGALMFRTGTTEVPLPCAFKTLKLVLKNTPQPSTAVVDGKEFDLGTFELTNAVAYAVGAFDNVETILVGDTVVYGSTPPMVSLSDSVEVALKPQSYAVPGFSLGEQFSLVRAATYPTLKYVILTAESQVDLLEILFFDENHERITSCPGSTPSSCSNGIVIVESLSSNFAGNARGTDNLIDGEKETGNSNDDYISAAAAGIKLVFMYTGSGKSLSSVDIIPRYNDQLTQHCDTWKLYGTQEEDVIENINHANAEWEYDLREICEGKNFNLHPDAANSLPRAFVDLKNLMSVKTQSSTSSIKINDFSHIVTHIKDDEDSLSIVNLENVVNNGVHDITPGNAYVIAPLGEWSDIQIDSNKIKGTFCGDGIITNNEECDDGNQLYNDGCNADCTVHVWYTCTPQTYLAGTDWPKTNAEVGSCLLQTYCGDGRIDNNAAFHTQQQYRRIPYTEMTLGQYTVSSSTPTESQGHDLQNIIDPDICASHSPALAYYSGDDIKCGLLGAGTDSREYRTDFTSLGLNNKLKRSAKS